MDYNHELVMPNEDLPFKLFLFEGTEGNYKRMKHWHRSVEIFLVLEGQLTFRINSRDYELGDDEFIIVNSNEVHAIDAPHKNETIVLQIPIKIFQNYLTAGSYILFRNGNKKHDPKMVSLIRSMYVVYEEKQPGYELMVQSWFFQLLYLLISEYKVDEIDEEMLRKNRNLTRLSAITSYIRDNYNKDITLDGLAEMFGYSSSYLSRMFQKYARINFKQFLQTVRVEYGYRDLVHTDMTIGEIAAKHGFPNSKSFSKAFRHRYGELPSVYRKKARRE